MAAGEAGEILYEKVKEQFQKAVAESRRVVFVDEAYFTMNTSMNRAYSLKNTNIYLDKDRMEAKVCYLVAAVSA